MFMAAATSPPSPDSDPEAVLGIDNIPLDLPWAGIGSRTLAAAIDYAVLTILLPLALLALFGLGLLGVGSGWQIALALVLFFVLYWGYFLLQEQFLSGRTLGKMAVRLRVVSRHGGSPSFTQLVLRNLLRPVDTLVGMPLMAIDPLSRRIGDRVGGTLVVHDRPAEEREVSLSRIPEGWDARRIALAESFLRRAPEMDAERRDALARRFLELLPAADPETSGAAGAAATAAAVEDPLPALRQALGVPGD